jgi:hypothetical protein
MGAGDPVPDAPVHDVPVPDAPVPDAPVPDVPADPPHGRSLSDVGELVSQIGTDLSTLLRQEVALAKAELKQSATKAGKGAGMFGGAALGGYMVLLFLSIALWWAIGTWLGLGWSALIVAGVWAVITAVLAARGRRELKQIEGAPRTTETAREIPQALKGNEEIR